MVITSYCIFKLSLIKVIKLVVIIALMLRICGRKFTWHIVNSNRNSPLEVFLGESVLKICRKFTGEHPCRIVIFNCKLQLQSNFIEITLRHVCSPVHLLYIFRTPFHKNSSGRLLLVASSNSRWVIFKQYESLYPFRAKFSFLTSMFKIFSHSNILSAKKLSFRCLPCFKHSYSDRCCLHLNILYM